MKSIIDKVSLKHPIGLTEIDISKRPELQEEFSNDIPVLLCGNRVLARHRISVSQLLSQLTVPCVTPHGTKKIG